MLGEGCRIGKVDGRWCPDYGGPQMPGTGAGFFTMGIVIEVFGRGVIDDNPGRGMWHGFQEGELEVRDQQR